MWDRWDSNFCSCVQNCPNPKFPYFCRIGWGIGWRQGWRECLPKSKILIWDRGERGEGGGMVGGDVVPSFVSEFKNCLNPKFSYFWTEGEGEKGGIMVVL